MTNLCNKINYSFYGHLLTWWPFIHSLDARTSRHRHTKKCTAKKSDRLFLIPFFLWWQIIEITSITINKKGYNMELRYGVKAISHSQHVLHIYFYNMIVNKNIIANSCMYVNFLLTIQTSAYASLELLLRLLH